MEHYDTAPDMAREFDQLRDHLNKLVSDYETAMEELEKLKQSLKEAEADLDSRKDMICSIIMDIEDRFGVTVTANSDRFKYSVGRKTYYGIPSENKEGVMHSLVDLGWEDLIQHKVDPRTLTKQIQDVTDGDGKLPQKYDALIGQLSTYERSTLTRRRK